jgi:flagellar biogenesis protein FliO
LANKKAVATARLIADAIELSPMDDEDVVVSAAPKPNLALEQALAAISAASSASSAAAEQPAAARARRASTARMPVEAPSVAATSLRGFQAYAPQPIVNEEPAESTDFDFASLLSSLDDDEDALELSTSAQPAAVTPVRKPTKAKSRKAPAPKPAPETQFEPELLDALEQEERAQKPAGIKGFLAALDKLPPIKLPLGPAIPWKVGLPLLCLGLVAMMFVYRPSTAAGEQPGTTLPKQETYAAQDAPLFANSRTDAAPAQIGVTEPAGASVDFVDLGIKLVAVLGLAYGSLMLLKKFGLRGQAASQSGQPGMKVLSTLALAPNRTVHELRTPTGKALLVGATPNQVSLLADLGELDAEVLSADSASFLDVLSAKLK